VREFGDNVVFLDWQDTEGFRWDTDLLNRSLGDHARIFNAREPGRTVRAGALIFRGEWSDHEAIEWAGEHGFQIMTGHDRDHRAIWRPVAAGSSGGD
jgi:hypothetical protein